MAPGTLSASQAAAINGTDSPYYALLTDVDPENRAHWVEKFRRFKEDRFNMAWNWPSFFFGPWRYFVKGMSGKAIIYILPFIIVAGFIEGAAGPDSGLTNLAGLAASVFYGIMGSNDYFKFCRKYRGNLAGAKKAKKLGKINLFLFIFGPIILVILAVMSGV